MAILAIAAPASAAPKVDVSWAATGTYTLDAVGDNGSGCDSTYHFTANIDSKLASSFNIPDDGIREVATQSAVVQNPFATGSLQGESILRSGDGTCDAVIPYHCPDAPWTASEPSMLSGAAGGPISLNIQPAKHVGAETNPCTHDGSGLAGYNAVTADQLNDSLPTALATKLSVDEQELRDKGTVTRELVIDNDTNDLPRDCSAAMAARLGSPDIACNQSLSLNATVTLTIADRCPAGSRPSGERCLTDEQKEQYATSAGAAEARSKGTRCTPGERKKFGSAVCDAVDRSAKEAKQTASQYLKLAADPPDPNFDSPVTLHVPKVDRLGGDAHAFDRFRQADARLEALMAALLHALERSAGAAAAGDAGWVDTHNQELTRFATQALDALDDRAKAAKGAIGEFKDGLGPKHVAKTLMGDDLGGETDAAIAALAPTAAG